MCVDNRPLGRILCHLISYSLAISAYVNTLTSLVIAIDRYFVIIYPFKPRMKLSVCILLIVVVWIVSFSISLPLAIFMKLIEVTVDGVPRHQCVVSASFRLYLLNNNSLTDSFIIIVISLTV